MKPFQLTLCQMQVEAEKERNWEKMETMVRHAAAREQADVVVLPEIFNSLYSIEAMEEAAEPVNGPTVQRLARLAEELKIVLVGGSISEKEDGRIYNSSFTFDPSGRIIARHRKMHLFDVDIPGGVTFQESAVLSPGNDVTVFDTSCGRLGVAICYDMRFPELMRLMCLHGAELIIVPAAFNTTTGPMHWRHTIRARAVDNQVFFAAASPARNPGSDYQAYGHSMIVDPWGEVLAETDEKESFLSVRLDPRRIDEARSQLPLLQHRRTDLYELTPADPWIIDRFEGDEAVVETEEGFRHVPRNRIMGGAAEGDVLTRNWNGSCRVDLETTRIRRERIAKRLHRLRNDES